MSSPRQEGQRPRAKSALSFTSNKSYKSHKSNGSSGKMDLTETSKDKRHLNTKADPTLAMNESQPATVALEASNLAPLRGIQHRDAQGNLITDPDLSNPTRHRFERPLDTIRGFEEAWSGSYSSRRKSTMRPTGDRPDSRGTGVTGDFSRRSSAFFSGYANNPQVPQGRGNQEGGYYGNRNSMNRPDSFIDQYSSSPQQFQGQGRFPRPNPRMNSEPMLYGAKAQQTVYPSHAYQQSYDTVTSGATQGTEPWGNSTDPSSENSSMDRIQPLPKQTEQQQQMSENYGLNGFGTNLPFQLNELPQGQGQPGNGRNGFSQNGYGQGGPSGLNRFQTAPEYRPMPPPKTAGPRVPIKLDPPSGSPLTQEISRESSGKRKSWLMRRFSKK